MYASSCEARRILSGSRTRAGFKHAVIAFQQAMAIGAEIGDALAGLDAQRTQRSGQARRAFRKLSVGKALVATDDGRAAGNCWLE